MSDESIVSDRAAHPLELFFDLVFVYAITQVVSLLVHDLSPAGFGKAALVFWMIWWSWSQYTWATNGSDIDDNRERVGLLAATAVAFFMAQSVPVAFEEAAPWFALPYAGTRVLALFLYWIGVKEDPVYRKAFLSYLPVSSLGLVIAAVGGFVAMPGRVWVWLLAIVADVTAAFLGQRGDWALKPAHFAERHGLILIIALGESIIAVGVASADAERTATLAVAIGLGVVTTCILWWTYFDAWWEKGESWLAETPIEDRGRVGRNLYSFMHYPLLAGVIAFAVSVEEIIAHPDEPLGRRGAGGWPGAVSRFDRRERLVGEAGTPGASPPRRGDDRRDQFRPPGPRWAGGSRGDHRDRVGDRRRRVPPEADARRGGVIRSPRAPSPC